MSDSASFAEQCNRIIESQGRVPDPDRLQQFFAFGWHHRMEDNPEWATAVGYSGFDHLWTDQSPEAFATRRSDIELQLRVLQSIEKKHLTDQDRLSYDLFEWGLQQDRELLGFRKELLPMSQMDGVQQDAARILSMMPVATATQADSFLSRLERLPVLIDQTIALMREGIREKITPPRITLSELPNQIANQISDRAEDAPVLAALKKVSGERLTGHHEPLLAESYRLYALTVRPAFERLKEFAVQTYLPACRIGTSWTELPRGAEWYAWLVKNHTTTTMTPDEVFEVGQSEVVRIRGEMERVIKESGFKGNFAEFCEFLRTDPKFYFSDAKQLLMTYRDIAKRVDPELARFFGVLPRLPYGVIPIPSYAERSQTTAYYEPGSPQAGRPGYFYANTYDLKARPKWEMEALTLHEAVPGHHLQIALAQEQADLPEFRKNLWVTAYGEGWALYSESLGEQMGFYADPYAKFGQLTYEMWRAVRLVVDPGLHAKGWSRQQAIDFFARNSSKPLHDIEVEIDRYIVWPGQALAYKIGELKIREIRQFAERALGERFDMRAFHDRLLETGCIPLDVLEQRLRRWVESR